MSLCTYASTRAQPAAHIQIGCYISYLLAVVIGLEIPLHSQQQQQRHTLNQQNWSDVSGTTRHVTYAKHAEETLPEALRNVRAQIQKAEDGSIRERKKERKRAARNARQTDRQEERKGERKRQQSRFSLVEYPPHTHTHTDTHAERERERERERKGRGAHHSASVAEPSSA